MNNSILNDIKFAFHILTHPFDGFWDLKRESKGKVYLACIFFAFLIITNILNQQVTGFLFNSQSGKPIDLLFSVQSVASLVILFCVGNWSVTTLLDGEGRFKDIFMTLGYAFLPYIIINIPIVFISNILTYAEYPMLALASYISVGWSFGLLFFGIMVIHDYSLPKMFITTILTIVAMMVLIVIYLLFFNLISQIANFILLAYKEIEFRFN